MSLQHAKKKVNICHDRWSRNTGNTQIHKHTHTHTYVSRDCSPPKPPHSALHVPVPPQSALSLCPSDLYLQLACQSISPKTRTPPGDTKHSHNAAAKFCQRNTIVTTSQPLCQNVFFVLAAWAANYSQVKGGPANTTHSHNSAAV